MPPAKFRTLHTENLMKTVLYTPGLSFKAVLYTPKAVHHTPESVHYPPETVLYTPGHWPKAPACLSETRVSEA